MDILSPLALGRRLSASQMGDLAATWMREADFKVPPNMALDLRVRKPSLDSPPPEPPAPVTLNIPRPAHPDLLHAIKLERLYPEARPAAAAAPGEELQRELARMKHDWSRCRLDLPVPARPTSGSARRGFDGSRGVGWTAIGDVIIPYIMRGPSKYVSVRVVEHKLLAGLHGVDLEKMANAGPLYSYYITEQEARLFTEINARCYHGQFGSKPFSTQDLIVSLTEFERFYRNLRKQCGLSAESAAPPPLLQEIADVAAEGVEGGWVQINNTVVPYVFRNGVKFVPLSVIKYAAGLLTDVRIDGYKTPATDTEYKYLNSICHQVGVEFLFIKCTNLIKLELVIRMSNCKVTIKELPMDNPFSQATYQPHVRDSLVVFPLTPSSSPDLAANQNPALFRIPCPTSTSPSSQSSSSAAVSPASALYTPVTAIASHALQYFNASVAAAAAAAAAAAQPPPPPRKKERRSPVPVAGQPNKIVIECVEFEGKTLPCLQRGGVAANSFVLVESVMRLYFPSTPLEHFVDVLQGVMDVPVVMLRSVEEQAFIRFYTLPVRAMRYKYLIAFADLRRCFADLRSYLSVGVLQRARAPLVEAGDSPVTYVVDSKLRQPAKLSPGPPSPAAGENNNNLQEERQALLYGYHGGGASPPASPSPMLCQGSSPPDVPSPDARLVIAEVDEALPGDPDLAEGLAQYDLLQDDGEESGSPDARKRPAESESEDESSPPVKKQKMTLAKKLESALAKLKQIQQEKLGAGEESQ